MTDDEFKARMDRRYKVGVHVGEKNVINAILSDAQRLWRTGEDAIADYLRQWARQYDAAKHPGDPPQDRDQST